MSEKPIVITEQGLLKVSKELINKRTYLESLITIEGQPLVIDGVASQLSEADYFLKNNLDLSETTSLKINMKGKFASSDTPTVGQCLWSLQDSSNNSLSLQFFGDKVQLIKDATVLASLDDVIYTASEVVDISLTLTNSTYKFVYVKDSEYNVASGNLSEEIDVTVYTSAKIGTLAHGSEQYWWGSLNLADFIIFKDNTLYYSPSAPPTFNFTKILVSDGTIELTDNSSPVLNHIYEFSVDEVQRTGNNILLTATIGGSAHLNITEIGLYSSAADGTTLFATVSGLAIKKSADLGYNLIFTVNMNLGVVNTVALPEIILISEDKVVKRDFLTVQQAYAYLITNLERCIVLNAVELGRERDQNALELENTYELQQANYNSSKIFSDIKKRIHESETYIYNPIKINTVGSPTITSAGMLSGLSTSNYVTLPIGSGLGSDIEIETAFTNESISSSEQTILNLYSNTVNDPLRMFINQSGRFCVSAGALETISVLNTSLSNVPTKFNRMPTLDRTLSGVAYYAWQNEEKSTWTNSHVTYVGDVFDSSGILSQFSSTSYATSPSTFTFGTNDFEFVIGFTVGTTGTAQGILSSTTGDYYIDISMGTDAKLTYNFGDGSSWYVPSASVTGSITLNSDGTYLLKITYDGAAYTAYISSDNGVTYTQDWTYTASALGTCNFKFGADNSSNVWGGTINLGSAYVEIDDSVAWNGVNTADYLFTTTKQPTTSSTLVDSSGFTPYNFCSITAVDTTEISKTFFSASLSQKYYIKLIVRSGYLYVAYSTDARKYITLCMQQITQGALNYTSSTYIGVLNNDGTIQNPFAGEIYLQNTRVLIDGNDFSPVDTEHDYRSLRDFYSFIDPKRSVYYINNLSGLENSQIRVIENVFSGNKDLIDFSLTSGASLCVKTYFSDTSDRYLLVKMNRSENEKYLELKLENKTLIFNLYTDTDVITLKKEYTASSISSIIGIPLLISIVYSDSPTSASIKMYVNNTQVHSITGTITGFLTAENYSLYNIESSDDDVDEIYVEGIASFRGALSEDNIYYLTNVVGTNF